jgi:hypothetical protein
MLVPASNRVQAAMISISTATGCWQALRRVVCDEKNVNELPLRVRKKMQTRQQIADAAKALFAARVMTP